MRKPVIIVPYDLARPARYEALRWMSVAISRQDRHCARFQAQCEIVKNCLLGLVSRKVLLYADQACRIEQRS
ncbi:MULTISPECIES: hypothetical protein [Rhizobium]|uniref:hypothetical protein n=1 Tax=Rhizobium TaxID=379 RepID=UPI001956900B|nr:MULTISPECIES: hypothetical protein [Rhizobium]MBM7045478.1 hypothetical protein [Rhizobium lusitanum]